MAICSHCGKQSQANALICQFCGYPLTTQEADTSAQDTVYTTPPAGEDQNGAQETTLEQQGNGALARIIVRPLQGASEPPREYTLNGQNISIGRSPSCEIVLEHDQLTSRRHALLRFDGTRYTVVDLGSSNGTFVNDSEIRDATTLSNGDRIIVGEHELMFTTTVSGAAPVAAVDMHSAPPSSPLGITGAQPAVNPAQLQAQQEPPVPASADYYNADEADTSYMATVMSPMEPAPTAVADMSNVAGVSDVAEVSDVSDVSEVSGLAETSDVSDVSDVAEVASTADEAETSEPLAAVEDTSAPESEMIEQPSSGPLPPPSTPDNTPLLARAPSSGALRQPGGELDQLRDQLAQLAATSEAVARHAAEETDISEQRRQALAETRDQLHAILAGIQNASSEATEGDDPGDLTDLIALTQQTAADPNHLQNISRMAEHAGDIARALEALQARRIQPPRPSASENALAELRALQARLDELA